MRQSYLRNSLLQLSGCELKRFWCSVWGEAHNTHEIVTKRCKNRGFRDFEVVRYGASKEGELKRSKMARVYPFNNGVLMLRNISAPLLSALKGNPRWTLRGCGPHNWVAFTGGKCGFFIFVRYLFTKKTTHSWTYWRKKAPRNWTQQHIYIYIYIWLLPRHLPTCLVSKPIYHQRLAQKNAFFFSQIWAKNYTVFKPQESRKHLLPPVLQRFLVKKGRNPLFCSISTQNVTLPLVMLIMSLMFWVPVSKKCLKRW